MSTVSLEFFCEWESEDGSVQNDRDASLNENIGFCHHMSPPFSQLGCKIGTRHTVLNKKYFPRK